MTSLSISGVQGEPCTKKSPMIKMCLRQVKHKDVLMYHFEFRSEIFWFAYLLRFHTEVKMTLELK